ncbi:hypothetical protein LSH36_321g04004 [Paralvinella palmiformis]|uniref:Uncharacterized protein n=1 Tax=Paralvinella palmiformis TaxID=53620 RepID=A0AAD9JHC2_9ANNE|nr:hypothetical protein LSH36_321g04004 [Paralvinella palmiformis]
MHFLFCLMFCYLLIKPLLADGTTENDVKTNYTVACGYYTCDVRYEFCSTGFVWPECLPCSGMCSYNRVVNDHFAIKRCQKLCPEYWRRQNVKTTTVPSIKDGTIQTCPDPNQEHPVLSPLPLIGITIAVVLTAVNVISTTVTVCLCWTTRRGAYFNKAACSAQRNLLIPI